MLTFHAVRIQKLAVKGREGGMEGGVFAPGTVALRDGMGGGGDGGSYHATQFHRAAGIKPQKY